ncbi:hypothetical protein RFI_21865, partial [Reticulomyxa filosa]
MKAIIKQYSTDRDLRNLFFCNFSGCKSGFDISWDFIWSVYIFQCFCSKSIAIYFGQVSCECTYICIFFFLERINRLKKKQNRYAMFFGSCTYFMFVASNIVLYPWLLYTTSAIEGIGAALLWVGQGQFITQCANQFEINHQHPLNSKLGYFNGVFWLFFQANQVIGNLLCALLFQFHSSNKVVYIVLSALCLFGCLCFLFISSPSSASIPLSPVSPSSDTFSPHFGTKQADSETVRLTNAGDVPTTIHNVEMTTQSSNQNSKVDENEVKNENKSENTNAHRNLSSSPPSVDPL